eukprot:4122060-Pleurochrysis_carterae.AAC.1
MTAVHFALLGTLALQTDLQRRDPLGPYVPYSGFADLVALPIQPIRHAAGDTDTDEESPTQSEGVTALNPAVTAAAAGRAARVAELASLMQTLALGRSYDANRMVARISDHGSSAGRGTAWRGDDIHGDIFYRCSTATASAAAAVPVPSSSTSMASPAAAPVPASAFVSTTAVSSALGAGTGTPAPPPQHATAVRPPWFPEPERVPPPPPSLTGRVPPPPPSLTEEIKRVILAMREEEEANARRLDT